MMFYTRTSLQETAALPELFRVCELRTKWVILFAKSSNRQSHQQEMKLAPKNWIFALSSFFYSAVCKLHSDIMWTQCRTTVCSRENGMKTALYCNLCSLQAKEMFSCNNFRCVCVCTVCKFPFKNHSVIL